MKKLTAFILAFVLLFTFAACGGTQEAESTQAPQTPSASAQSEKDSGTAALGKTLVVYFSASGNTESVAKSIAKATNGTAALPYAWTIPLKKASFTARAFTKRAKSSICPPSKRRMKWAETSERCSMVFYFTATGNSLYAAKKLSEHPISIPQALKHGKLSFTADKIGIVCPVYCGEIPRPVWEFIQKAEFHTPYLYLILTYGMDESDSAEFTYRQCEKIGVRFDYIHCVNTVDNYLPAFDMQAQKAMEKNTDTQLEAVLRDVDGMKKEIPTATEAGRKLHARVAKMNKIMPSLNNGKALKITDKCTGCGVCTQVCPIGNITVTTAAQRIRKKCAFCLACIQNCPHNAIRLKSEKNPNARYRNENITLQEIIEANCQQ